MIDFNSTKVKKNSVKQTEVISPSCGSTKRTRVTLTKNNKDFLKKLGFKL